MVWTPVLCPVLQSASKETNLPLLSFNKIKSEDRKSCGHGTDCAEDIKEKKHIKGKLDRCPVFPTIKLQQTGVEMVVLASNYNWIKPWMTWIRLKILKQLFP